MKNDRTARNETRARRWVVVGLVLIALGLAIASSWDPTAGGLVLLAGWGTGLWSLHRYGRTGAQAMAEELEG
ncbi:MAG: hypothetical protein WCI05_03140 [Myxococcales bacterium]